MIWWILGTPIGHLRSCVRWFRFVRVDDRRAIRWPLPEGCDPDRLALVAAHADRLRPIVPAHDVAVLQAKRDIARSGSRGAHEVRIDAHGARNVPVRRRWLGLSAARRPIAATNNAPCDARRVRGHPENDVLQRSQNAPVLIV